MRCSLPNYPDGGEVVRSVTERLADVELTHTELEPKDRERLSNMGIFTVGSAGRLAAPRAGPAISPRSAGVSGKADWAAAGPENTAEASGAVSLRGSSAGTHQRQDIPGTSHAAFW